MIGMAVVLSVVTVSIALLYNAWAVFDEEARYFVMKIILKAAVFTFIALAILVVIVNVF
jgi:hypothetical protein